MKCVVVALAVVALANAALSGSACSSGTHAGVNKAFTSWASNKWQSVRDELPLRRLRLNAVKTGVPAFPASRFSGNGIVMVAERLALLAPAYRTFSTLRENGISAPAELWVAGGEPTPEASADFAALGVSLKDLATVATPDQLAFRDGKRPQAVALALIHSSFENVLLLDVDNVALDADELLGHPGLSSGMVLWPSEYKTSPANPIWDLVGASCVDSFEASLTQALVNKEKAWAALHVAAHLSTPFYSFLLNGNADTLRMGALTTGAAFTMEAKAPARTQAARAQIPQSVEFLVSTQACTELTEKDRIEYANKNIFNVQSKFASLADGTSEYISFPKSSWKPACKAFAAGGTDCDGDKIQNVRNIDVAFANITMGGKAARLKFYHRGTDRRDKWMNISMIQVSDFKGNNYDCDAFGFLYTRVEKNDALPDGSFLLMAAYDREEGLPADATSMEIQVVYNAVAAVRPALAILLLAVLALFANTRF